LRDIHPRRKITKTCPRDPPSPLINHGDTDVQQ
jgi:hypothetical protein